MRVILNRRGRFPRLFLLAGYLLSLISGFLVLFSSQPAAAVGTASWVNSTEITLDGHRFIDPVLDDSNDFRWLDDPECPDEIHVSNLGDASGNLDIWLDRHDGSGCVKSQSGVAIRIDNNQNGHIAFVWKSTDTIDRVDRNTPRTYTKDASSGLFLENEASCKDSINPASNGTTAKLIVRKEGGGVQSKDFQLQQQYNGYPFENAIRYAGTTNGNPDCWYSNEVTVALGNVAQRIQPPGSIPAGCPGSSVAGPPAPGTTCPDPAQGAATTSPPCKAAGGGILTYIMCPVFNFIIETITSISTGVIEPFLKINPVTTKQVDGNESVTYSVWKAFRDLANIVFVLVFLVIIFSNTFSLGLDNYQIKKSLPRLVAAVIAVQFSFVVVGFMVDVTNILGAGIGQLITSAVANRANFQLNGIVSAAGIGGTLLGLVALAGTVLSGGILVLAIGVFFAILGIFFTLVLRQILVTLLVFISPLAFAAWVLPNTENLFRLWYKNLARVLLMYPMIVLLFAAGRIAGVAAANTSGGGEGQQTIASIISLLANIIPLFLIPLTFRFAGSALVAGAAAIQRLRQRGHAGVQDSDTGERYRNWSQRRRNQLAAQQGINIRGKTFGAQNRLAMGAGKIIGRGGNPFRMGRTGDLQAMSAFARDRAAWDKRLDEENMTFEGKQVLDKGNEWLDRQRYGYHDAQTNTWKPGLMGDPNAPDKEGKEGTIATARAAGKTLEADSLADKLQRLNIGGEEAQRYMSSPSARASAAKWMADQGLTDNDDRRAMAGYTDPRTGKAVRGYLGQSASGQRILRQEWGRNKEGARKGSVDIAFTDANGNLDVPELKKYVSRQNQSIWSGYTIDAINTLEKTNILSDLAADPNRRAVIESVLSTEGGPSIGADQQAVIRKVLAKVPPPPDYKKGARYDQRDDGGEDTGGTTTPTPPPTPPPAPPPTPPPTPPRSSGGAAATGFTGQVLPGGPTGPPQVASPQQVIAQSQSRIQNLEGQLATAPPAQRPAIQAQIQTQRSAIDTMQRYSGQPQNPPEPPAATATPNPTPNPTPLTPNDLGSIPAPGLPAEPAAPVATEAPPQVSSPSSQDLAPNQSVDIRSGPSNRPAGGSILDPNSPITGEGTSQYYYVDPDSGRITQAPTRADWERRRESGQTVLPPIRRRG